ncbi:cysteine--tRNA ligase [Candidatus Gracilibacteria bacterium]|nr:cysteine--tRNA ligase [Candidatus Gracilibacteria bacterium]
MKLKLYNTLTRTKEEFIPLMEDSAYQGPKKDFVGIYSCGPTVYSMPHFGNVRASFTADLIRNTIQYILGYKTISVMNFTDVGHLAGDSDDGEEKMEKAARQEGLTARDLAKKYEEVFIKFFKDLNIDPFTIMPRATEHIQEQIDLVKSLESKGYTYVIDGDGVYMDTSKIPDYGKLLGPNYKKALGGIKGGERVDLKGKKNLTDFALWKFHIGDGKRDMERESPRGVGFPGRHAECSAMSSKYLGDQFDIHHGGYDLIPVHHTNEIAQSECSTGLHPRVKYRIHNQFVLMNGKKMAKSDGNTVSPFEVIDKGYSYLDMRYFFFTTHYSSFFDFTRDSIQQAQNTRKNLIKKLSQLEKNYLFEDIQSFNLIENKLNTEIGKKFRTETMEAICDDINTPQVIATINSYLSNVNNEIISIIYRLENKFLKVGLFDSIVEEKIEIPSEIIDLAKQRLQAKKDKNFTLADEFRNKIQDVGYQIKDTPDGFEIFK